MKKTALYYTVAMLLCMGAVSCGKDLERKIRFEGVERISMYSFSGVDLSAGITNQSGVKLRLEDAAISFFYDDTLIVQAQLIGDVCVPPHTSNLYDTRWKLHLEDPTVLMRLEKILKGDARDLVTVSFRATVKGGPMRRRISQEKIPLSDFLNIFGASSDKQKEHSVLQ